MTVTPQDLADFHQFAQQTLSASGADSIEDLARKWRESRELAELADAIATSEADIEAGRVHPAKEVFAEIRQKLGLNQ